MDNRQFARDVAAWIDPDAIRVAAERYESDEQEATAPGTIVLGSRVLESGSEAGLHEIVSDFVGGFRLPEEALQTIREIIPSEFAHPTWDWLAALRFRGEISIDPDVRLPDGMKAILALTDSDVVVDILSQPINMLVHTVSLMAQTWRGVLDSVGKERLFFISSASGPLFSHLEKRVASACGVQASGERGVTSESGALNVRYRAVTAIVRQKSDATELSRLLKAAREAATEQAHGTLSPISRRLYLPRH